MRSQCTTCDNNSFFSSDGISSCCQLCSCVPQVSWLLLLATELNHTPCWMVINFVSPNFHSIHSGLFNFLLLAVVPASCHFFTLWIVGRCFFLLLPFFNMLFVVFAITFKTHDHNLVLTSTKWLELNSAAFSDFPQHGN